MPAAEGFRQWHDFYVVIATAAATLVGLMFVVVSIGSGYLSQKREAGIRAFFSPIVVHFGAVLCGSALALAPLSPPHLAALFGAFGLLGLGFSVRVWSQIGRLKAELSDRVWYALLPVASYGAMLAAALLIPDRLAAGLETLAAALILLLVIGIRNAWDLTIFIIGRG